MKFNDATFLSRAAQPVNIMPERRPLSVRQKQLLQGVGDRNTRRLAFLANSIAPTPQEPQRKWAAGDFVEFVTNDKILREGRLERKGEHGWYVRIDDGEVAIVPEQFLQQSRTAVVQAIREEIRGKSVLSEPRAAIRLNDSGDVSITLKHSRLQKVDDDDILQYVSEKYPKARILDVNDQSDDGVIGVVLAFESVDFTQVGPSQTGTEDRPGVVDETVQGTGHIGLEQTGAEEEDVDDEIDNMTEDELYDVLITSAHQAAQTFENANPGIVVIPAETEKSFGDGDTAIVRMGFAIQSDTHDPLFLMNGELTDELSDTAVPARGFIQAHASGKNDVVLLGPSGEESLELYGLKAAQVEPPYSQGEGPLPTREDYPGAATSGDYVVKAEDKDAKSPATDEDDGALREVLDPARLDDGKFETEHQAKTDSPTEEYYTRYFGPYGDMQTRDVPRRKHEAQINQAQERREIILTAWKHHNNSVPSAEDFLHILRILKQSYKPRVLYAMARNARTTYIKKYGQDFGRMTPGELAGGLMEQTVLLPEVDATLEKIIVNYIAANKDAIKHLVSDMAEEAKTRVLQLAISHNNKLYKDLSKSFVKNQEVIEKGPKKQTREKVREFFMPKWRKEVEQEQRGEAWQDTLRRRRDQTTPATPTQGPAAPAETTLEQWKKELADKRKQVPPAPAAPQPTAQDKSAISDISSGIFNLMGTKDKRKAKKVEEWVNANVNAGKIDLSKGTEEALSQAVALFYKNRPVAERIAQRDHQAPLAKADMRFFVDKQWAAGDYVHLQIIWDPDMCDGMAPGNIRQNLVTYVKQLEGNPEFHDYGAIGKPRFREFDPEAGLAEVVIRSSTSNTFVPEWTQENGSENKVNRM